MAVVAQGLKNSVAAMAATGIPPNTTGWMDCSGLAAPLSVTVEGAAAGDAIEIRVSNDPHQPDPTNQGVLYGSAVVATGKVEILAPYRWIRLNRSTAAGSPATVSAYLAAARTPMS
jgi:hypothetical protein